MTRGPGKYEAEAAAVLEATGAVGVVVIVFGGPRGTGATIQLPADGLAAVPPILRELAAQIDSDVADEKRKN